MFSSVCTKKLLWVQIEFSRIVFQVCSLLLFCFFCGVNAFSLSTVFAPDQRQTTKQHQKTPLLIFNFSLFVSPSLRQHTHDLSYKVRNEKNLLTKKKKHTPTQHSIAMEHNIFSSSCVLFCFLLFFFFVWLYHVRNKAQRSLLFKKKTRDLCAKTLVRYLRSGLAHFDVSIELIYV